MAESSWTYSFEIIMIVLKCITYVVRDQLDLDILFISGLGENLHIDSQDQTSLNHHPSPVRVNNFSIIICKYNLNIHAVDKEYKDIKVL